MKEPHLSKMRALWAACEKATMSTTECLEIRKKCEGCPHNPCDYCKEHKLYHDPFDPAECADCTEAEVEGLQAAMGISE